MSLSPLGLGLQNASESLTEAPPLTRGGPPLRGPPRWSRSSAPAQTCTARAQRVCQLEDGCLDQVSQDCRKIHILTQIVLAETPSSLFRVNTKKVLQDSRTL